LLQHGANGRAVGAGRWVLDPWIAPLLAAGGASAGVGISGEESGDWVRISCTGNQGRKDDPTYVAALLRYGAGVDQRYHGATPLHYAVKAGFVHMIRILLDRGADKDALDDRGRTPATGSVNRRDRWTGLRFGTSWKRDSGGAGDAHRSVIARAVRKRAKGRTQRHLCTEGAR
jgi:hypothetical protein